MVFGRHLKKHLHPVLKASGFAYKKPFWVTDASQPWRTVLEVTSDRMLNGEVFLAFDIGLFSYEIDMLTDAKAREFVCAKEDLPLGVIGCHFQTSIFSLTDNGEWFPRKDNGCVFETEAHAVSEIKIMSERFENVLPKLTQRYANYQALVDCKYKNVGTEAQSKKAGLFAAAACIILGKYDEARALLNESIRPGSSPYDKKIGAALSLMIK